MGSRKGWLRSCWGVPRAGLLATSRFLPFALGRWQNEPVRTSVRVPRGRLGWRSVYAKADIAMRIGPGDWLC
jgi:hypothetical protein